MSLYKVDGSTGDLSLVAGGTLYADTPIGTVQATLDPSAPSGWVFLRGQTVSRNEWLELLDWATKKNLIGSGKPFGPGDGSTTFVLPDLREATLKGTGLTSKSENHYDADGVALGEFVEDRLQAHTHSNKTGTTTPGTQAWTMFATTQIESAVEATNDGLEGRFGTTTEVKAIGVNFMIKAKHTPVPADFLAAVNETISENTLTPVGPYNKVATTDRLLSSHSIGDNGYTFADLESSMYNTWFTNWSDDTNFPDIYGSGIFIVGKDSMTATLLYFVVSTGKMYKRLRKRVNDQPVWSDWELIVGATSGSANIDSTYVSGGNCTWVANGKVVTVTLNNFQTRAYSDGDHTLATGLPKPYQYVAFHAMEVGGTHTQLFSIGADGALKGASGTMKAGDYYQSVTYVTE